MKNRIKKYDEIYTIRVLDDEEFDKLPYENIKDSLGFADPTTKDAYVRKTGVKDMDAMTIQHELQELLASKSYHEDANGIRHKSFGKVMRDVVAPIVLTAINPALGATYAGINNYQQTGNVGKTALSAGLTFAGGKIGGGGKAFSAGFKGSSGGIVGKTLSGLKATAFGTPATAAQKATTGLLGTRGAFLGLGTKPVTTTSVGLGGGLASRAEKTFSAGTTTPVKFGGRYYNIGTTTAGELGAVNSAAPSLLGSISTIGRNAAPSVSAPISAASPTTLSTVGQTGIQNTASAGVNAGGNVFSKISKLATDQRVLGAASLLGSAIPQAPQFEIPSSITKLQNKFMNERGLSEVGKVVRGELLKTLQARPQDLFPAADDAFINASLRQIRKRYEIAQKQLDASYNQAGLFGSGEHLAARDRLRQEQTNTENDFVALENQRRFEMAQQVKQNATVQALQDAGLTEQQIMDIAALDVQSAAIKYGADVADMQIIKQALANIGVNLLSKGLFKKSQQDNINAAGGAVINTNQDLGGNIIQ